MELDVALNGMFEAQNKIRTMQGATNPVFMSLQMMHLSQFTGAVEEKLAELEQEYEVNFASSMKERLIDRQLKVTQAERETDIEMAEIKGNIKYLTRLVSASWRQVGVIQSRINHIAREMGTQI